MAMYCENCLKMSTTKESEAEWKKFSAWHDSDEGNHVFMLYTQKAIAWMAWQKAIEHTTKPRNEKE